MEKNYTFPADPINAVRIKLTWAQLEIIKGSHDVFHVHIAGHEDSIDEIRVDDKDHELYISQPQYTVAKEIVPLKRWIQVCVRVPDGWHGEIDASTVSGTLSANRVYGDDIAFTTVNGPLHIKNIRGSHVGIRSVSGAVSGDAIETKQLFLRTVSGKANVTNVQSVTSKIFTVSADIRLQLNKGAKALDIQSLSGDIQLEIEGPVKEASLRSLGGQCQMGEEVEKGENGLNITSMSLSGRLQINGLQRT